MFGRTTELIRKLYSAFGFHAHKLTKKYEKKRKINFPVNSYITFIFMIETVTKNNSLNLKFNGNQKLF